MNERVEPIRWVGEPADGALELLDQRQLPADEVYKVCVDARAVAGAIGAMVVRGAPAIGIAAAWGYYLGRRAGERPDDLVALLAGARPTAINLGWALERMRAAERAGAGLGGLFAEARAIADEDLRANYAIGERGRDLLADLLPDRPDRWRILTHCNTGALATGGHGTALGVIRTAHASGLIERVWIDETRPYLQGARLTAWECAKESIPGVLITDSMPAHFMQRGEVDAVIVGADRIAADGSTANKIGTYALAVLARYHRIPFVVAAPTSTLDLGAASAAAIPIEQRPADEVTRLGSHVIAPTGFEAAHPAFDVTPSELIDAIVTERGVARSPYEGALCELMRPRNAN